MRREGRRPPHHVSVECERSGRMVQGLCKSFRKFYRPRFESTEPVPTVRACLVSRTRSAKMESSMQIRQFIAALLPSRRHPRIPVLPVQLDNIQGLLKRVAAAEGRRTGSDNRTITVSDFVERLRATHRQMILRSDAPKVNQAAQDVAASATKRPVQVATHVPAEDHRLRASHM